MPLIATSKCWKSYKNGYAGLLVLQLLLPLNPWLIIKCSILKPFLYAFGRYSSELAQLVPLPFSQGRSTYYFDRLHDFSVTIPRCYKGVYVNSFFPCTARLWNCLPIECFPLTYNVNGPKSRTNRHLLMVDSFSYKKLTNV